MKIYLLLLHCIWWSRLFYDILLEKWSFVFTSFRQYIRYCLRTKHYFPIWSLNFKLIIKFMQIIYLKASYKENVFMLWFFNMFIYDLFWIVWSRSVNNTNIIGVHYFSFDKIRILFYSLWFFVINYNCNAAIFFNKDYNRMKNHLHNWSKNNTMNWKSCHRQSMLRLDSIIIGVWVT